MGARKDGAGRTGWHDRQRHGAPSRSLGVRAGRLKYVAVLDIPLCVVRLVGSLFEMALKR